jgi:hypothetical protein
MVVPVPVCGNPLVRDIFSHVVVMEIILAWLWLIGIVAFLVLVGCLLQGRQSRRSYCLKDRLLPDRMELFHQRRQGRKRHIIFRHFSRLS